MGKEDVGLARHSQECENEIDFENTKVKVKETRWREREVKEGIESLRAIHELKKLLHSFESLLSWRPVSHQNFVK